MTKRAPLTPQTGYLVAAALDYRDLPAATFLAFYQPLLGAAALNLLAALKSQLAPQPLLVNRQRVSTLLVQLNCGLPDLTRALERLEGLDLVKTFQQTGDTGVTLVLELQSPLAPAAFLEDDLLAVLLLQQVGADRFDQLAGLARQYVFDTSQLTQVSRDFFSVFTPDETPRPAEDQAIQKARKSLPRPVHQERAVADGDFDFAFFLRQADSLGVAEAQLRPAHDLVIAEHQLYGADEFQLATLAAQATDLASNRFDRQRFEQLVAAAYRQPASVANQPAGDEETAGMTGPMRQLVAVATKTPVIAFLNQLKQQAGGFATPNEQRTLTSIATNSDLPPAAINILAWYLLAEQGMDNLSAGLANSIASSWQAAGVDSATAALRQIERHQQKQAARLKQGSTAGKHRYSRKPVIKEKLPDWAKQGAKKAPTAVSAESTAKAKRLLAELKQQDKEEQEREGGKHRGSN